MKCNKKERLLLNSHYEDKKSPTHWTLTKMLIIDKEKYSRTFAPNLTFLFFGSKITSFNYNRYDPPCCKLLLFSSTIQVGCVSKNVHFDIFWHGFCATFSISAATKHYGINFVKQSHAKKFPWNCLVHCCPGLGKKLVSIASP